jgi:hypothetical protein
VTEPALLAHGVTAKVLAELERDSFATTSIDRGWADANLSGDKLSVSCSWRLECAPQRRPRKKPRRRDRSESPKCSLSSNPSVPRMALRTAGCGHR